MLARQGANVDASHPSPRLTDAERIDRLRLIRSDNIGPRGMIAQTPLGKIQFQTQMDFYEIRNQP